MADQKPEDVQTEGDGGEKGGLYLSEDVNRLRNGMIENVQEYDKVEERRIIRKIDFRLIPILVVLYLFSFLDRGNSKSFIVSPSGTGI